MSGHRTYPRALAAAPAKPRTRLGPNGESTMQIAANSMMGGARPFPLTGLRRFAPRSGAGVRQTAAIAKRPIPTSRASPSAPSTGTSGLRALSATATPRRETPAKATVPPPMSDNMRKSSRVRWRSDILKVAADRAIMDFPSHQGLHHELSVVALTKPLGLVLEPRFKRVGSPAKITYSPAVFESPHLLLRRGAQPVPKLTEFLQR